jgi:hypothetical protein
MTTSESTFEDFRQLVLSDDSLQQGLRVLTDKHAFIERVIELGLRHGHVFSRDDVEAAMLAGRRSWIEHTL